MLEAIRIQNFRSIKDITLDLQQINLLIGANNSGKSNFLKALEFFGDFIYTGKLPDLKILDKLFFRGSKREYLALSLFYKHKITELNYVYRLEIYDVENDEIQFSEFAGFSYDSINYKISISDVGHDLNQFYRYTFNVKNNAFYGINNKSEFFYSIEGDPLDFFIYKGNPASPGFVYEKEATITNVEYFEDRFEFGSWIGYLKRPIIYKPNPETFSRPASLQATPQVNSDGSNIVPFLFNLGQNNKKIYAQLEKDLALCVGDLVGISTPVDPENPTQLKIKFFDKNDHEYWADEVSEGVLYFLALLCIIHQPNPPQLLLLEEPEKGIHPVRIQEVMDFIFKLAEQKGIQIILTSHSPLILEEFKDIPESVFIFDKENGATLIKNLKTDVIDRENEDRLEKGLPAADYTSSLMSHWTVGLIGGVPKP